MSSMPPAYFTEQPMITWPESVDQALCFGWIDGLRKRVDDDRYQIRFTPRKTSSIWSTVNLARFTVLRTQGLVMSAGEAAYSARKAGAADGPAGRDCREGRLIKSQRYGQ